MDVGPAIDIVIVERLRDWFGPERAEQFNALLRSFNLEAETTIAAMEDEARRHDRPAVARLAHKLLGSSGTMGALGLAGRCADIDSLDVSACDDLMPLVSALAKERRRFSAALDHVLESPTHG